MHFLVRWVRVGCYRGRKPQAWMRLRVSDVCGATVAATEGQTLATRRGSAEARGFRRFGLETSACFRRLRLRSIQLGVRDPDKMVSSDPSRNTDQGV